PDITVGTDRREQIRRRGSCSVRPDARCLDNPLVAVAGPLALAIAPLGVKDPRADALANRVPADSLANVHGVTAAHLQLEILSKKLPSSLQRHEERTTVLPPSSIHSPTSQLSGRSRWWAVGGGPSSSRASAICHFPSRLMCSTV